MARKSIFNSINVQKPNRNKFDLSHEKKLTMNMGDLVPIFWTETMPGDTFKVDSEIFLRMAPMLAPIMHRVDVTTHYFKVPMRLLWNQWEEFITGGEDGTSYLPPPVIGTDQLAAMGTAAGKGSLADYLGLPVQNINTTPGYNIDISVLPFRAYHLIWNEFYRDQNLTDKLDYQFDLGGGHISAGDRTILMTMRQRAWEKDYFTSALPWPQRGAEMLLPMQFSVDEVYQTVSGDVNMQVGAVTADNAGNLIVSAGAVPEIGLRGDNATTTVSDLRTAIKIQQWLEKNARGGAKYIEQILHHFGVTSSDARLQRPEYLGGGKNPVVISEVLSTVEGAEPQGNMAGHGIAGGRTHGFETYCEEHCIIMGLMSVTPKPAYQDGLQRHWLRSEKFDYPFPELAHLGEQEIYQHEVFYKNGVPNPSGAWGYQSRYAEWKYIPDSVHGDFRDDLNFWHLGRQFDALPPLNDQFVMIDYGDTNRIFAVTDILVRKLYVQVYNNVSAIRPLPYFGTPQF